MRATLILMLAGILACCATFAQNNPGNRYRKQATDSTASRNKAVLQQLNFNNTQDSVDAVHGLILYPGRHTLKIADSEDSFFVHLKLKLASNEQGD